MESGLNYNYFRDYDAATGRYSQSDPIGLRGGTNTYGYVRANPLNRFDSLGLYEATLAPPGTITWPSWLGNLGSAAADIGLRAFGGVALFLIPSPIAVAPCEAQGGGACGRLIAQMNERGRGRSDPVTLPIVNPGRDCDGNCNPCPPGASWVVPKPGHGHEGGYVHVINYNQDPKTCTCYPDRPSGGLEGY